MAKRKRAALSDLIGKPVRTKEIPLNAGNGELTMLIGAIGRKAFDDLQGKYPAKGDDAKSGGVFDVDTFGPALIARSCVDPPLTHEQAKELWESEDWSKGELHYLFLECLRINNDGIDIPFTATVSETTPSSP